MSLSTHEAHARIAPAATVLADLPAQPVDWMGGEELQRLASITSPRRRQHFLGGHWLLRCLAAEVMRSSPQDWRVTANVEGTPGLQAMHLPQTEPVFASISHSGDWLAAALSRQPLGIDLECPRRTRDLEGLALMTFSPSECAQLAALDASEREAYFYLHWTIKEASAKRAGRGLNLDRARAELPLDCAAEAAEIFSWEFSAGALSLSAPAGTQVLTSGLPADARPSYHRLDAGQT